MGRLPGCKSIECPLESMLAQAPDDPAVWVAVCRALDATFRGLEQNPAATAEELEEYVENDDVLGVNPNLVPPKSHLIARAVVCMLLHVGDYPDEHS